MGIFLQLQGTAMGTKMAPSYANLFTGSLEPTLIQLGHPYILLWRQYIDDIFLIWTGSDKQLNIFFTNINQVHPTIKFTHYQNNREFTFLDVTVYKGPNFKDTGLLDVKTHTKPTNEQLYIHRTSYHPLSVKTTIPKRETLRYLCTNTCEEMFKHITQKLKDELIERGYKAAEITNITQQYPFHRCPELTSSTNDTTTTHPIVLPVKFGPLCNNIREILQTHWSNIEQDALLSTIFPKDQ